MNKNLTNRAIAKEVALDLESSDALNYYLSQLRETPLLSKEQEEELFLPRKIFLREKNTFFLHKEDLFLDKKIFCFARKSSSCARR